MAQQEKALAGIPEDMSLIPQTPGKRRRRAVYSGRCVHIHTYSHAHNNNK